MITVEMVRDKGFDVAEGDNVWRDIANEFIPISRVEARWIKEKIINSCSAIKEFSWRDNDGEMPCDGELLVEVEFKCGESDTARAGNLCWVIGSVKHYGIIKWRPSLKNWESEMNLDKIETQEEKEAFEGVANSSEIPNGSGWKNGDECMAFGVECTFIGKSHLNECDSVVMMKDGALKHHQTDMLSKPETPKQKAERERLEAAYEIYLAFWSASRVTIVTMSMDEFTECSDLHYWLAVVDKTNYRKQNN